MFNSVKNHHSHALPLVLLIPCCSCFQDRRADRPPGHKCDAQRGKCWAGIPGTGWCLCWWSVQRTGDTGRAILLTQHSTGVATRCWAIHRISHCDRVDLCNVIYILTHLGEKDTADENFPRDKKVLKTNFCCEYLHQRLCWYVGKPMCMKPKHFWSWCGCTLVSVYSLPMIPQHLCSSCLHPMEKTHWFSK